MLNDPQDQAYVKSLYDKLKKEEGPFGTETTGNEVLQQIATNSKTYKELQKIGKVKGCWECGAKMGTAGAAAWVMDHIPPQRLTKSVLGKLVNEMELQFKNRKPIKCWENYRAGKRRAVPSCHGCSSKQSKLVKRVIVASRKGILGDLIQDLTNHQKGMLFSFPNARSVSISGKGTKDARERFFKTNAVARCHICKRTVSTGKDSSYTADHFPPTELATSYAMKVFELADCDELKTEVRPHCKVCSSKQGGDWAAIAKRLQAIAKRNGIKIYKGV